MFDTASGVQSSFESCGVGVGLGITKGFQLLGTFFGSLAPNHPIFASVIGSVRGNHPFRAITPVQITSTTVDTAKSATKRFRPSAELVNQGKLIEGNLAVTAPKNGPVERSKHQKPPMVEIHGGYSDKLFTLYLWR